MHYNYIYLRTVSVCVMCTEIYMELTYNRHFSIVLLLLAASIIRSHYTLDPYAIYLLYLIRNQSVVLNKYLMHAKYP